MSSKASAGAGSSEVVKSSILMYWDTSARKAVVHNYKKKGKLFQPCPKKDLITVFDGSFYLGQ